MGLELLGPGASDRLQGRNCPQTSVELDQLIEEILLASRLDARESDLARWSRWIWWVLAAEECARVDASSTSGQLPSHWQTLGVAELAVQGVTKYCAVRCATCWKPRAEHAAARSL